MKRWIHADAALPSCNIRTLTYDQVKQLLKRALVKHDQRQMCELQKSRFYDQAIDEIRNAMAVSASQSIESLLDRVQYFIGNPRTRKWRSFDEGQYLHLEKHSVQSLIDNYIRYFNRNVDDYGDGFAADWDDDDWMHILYKDGKAVTINPQDYDGTKKIKTDNIDSIILDGSWGTAFAGPHIEAEDYTVYEDIPDIRIQFSI